MSIGGYSPITNQFVSSAKSGGILAARAAHTTAYASDPILNPGAVGLRVDVDISAIAASPSVVFKVQKYNQAAETWSDVLASAAKTGTGTFSLTVSPSVLAAANAVAQVEAPGVWRVITVPGDTDSMTFQIAYEYLVSQLLGA